jgi:hypothetical protein
VLSPSLAQAALYIDRYSGYDAVLLKESAAFLAKLSAQLGAK